MRGRATFTFESADAELTAAGDIAVNAGGEVTAVWGSISGLTSQTIRSITPNPGFPDAAYSPDGSFIYDNLYHPSGMAFDVEGLLFTTSGNPSVYWNLWGVSHGNYLLWESTGAGNYPIEESGTLSVAAVPELGTWAMFGLGFAALRLACRRRTPRLAGGSLE